MEEIAFLNRFRTITLKKGEMIFLQDTIPDRAYGVKEGIVKVYNLTSTGDEKSIAFKLKGDVFSLGWLFDRHERTLYFYEAYTDCVLHVIDKASFQASLYADHEFTAALINLLIGEHLVDGFRFNALSQSNATRKVVSLLHILCLRYGKTIAPDVVRINIPLRHQDIANMLGLTRESAGFELKKLQRQKVIAYSRRIYTIYTNKLNRLLDDGYNPDVSLKSEISPSDPASNARL